MPRPVFQKIAPTPFSVGPYAVPPSKVSPSSNHNGRTLICVPSSVVGKPGNNFFMRHSGHAQSADQMVWMTRAQFDGAIKKLEKCCPDIVAVSQQECLLAPREGASMHRQSPYSTRLNRHVRLNSLATPRPLELSLTICSIAYSAMTKTILLSDFCRENNLNSGSMSHRVDANGNLNAQTKKSIFKLYGGDHEDIMKSVSNALMDVGSGQFISPAGKVYVEKLHTLLYRVCPLYEEEISLPSTSGTSTGNAAMPFNL